MQKSFRRVVTGHDETGNAVILSDAPPERVRQVGGPAGPTFFEVWNTRETPAKIDRGSGEPAENGLVLAPPKGGTRIRVVDIPPESAEAPRMDEATARAHFEAVGSPGTSTYKPGAPHPLMHRTETINYGIVLEGELVLIVDRGETTVRAGDIVIQRGTNHLWHAVGTVPLRMTTVMVGVRA